MSDAGAGSGARPSAFAIEQEPDKAKPPRFVVRRIRDDATQEQRALADRINAELDRLSLPEHRRHPKFDEWVGLLREIARLALVEPEPGRPAPPLEALAAEIARDLKRFGDAPFTVRLEEDQCELMVERKPGTAPPSPDQEAFFEELLRAEHFLTTLYTPTLGISAPKEERRIVWKRIQGVATLALAQAQPTIALARTALGAVLRDAIRDRGSAVRAAYLGQLARGYVVAFLTFCVLLAAIHLGVRGCFAAACDGASWTWTTPEALRVPGERLLFFGITLGALAIGAWLSAAARLDSNSPEVLTTMLSEADPTLFRAFMVLGFGAVAVLLLHGSLVKVVVGDDVPVFDSSDVLKSLLTALLTGAFLGLAERALPAAVNERATAFVATLGPSGNPR